MTEERTLEATPAKLARARVQGDRAVSIDLVSAAVLGWLSLCLAWLGPSFVRGCAELIHASFSIIARVDDLSEPAARLGSALRVVLQPAAGLLLGCVLAALLAVLVQSGFGFAPGRVASGPGAATRLARVLSLDQLGNAALRAVACGLLLWALGTALYAVLPGLLDAWQRSPAQLARLAVKLLSGLVVRAAAVLVGLGLLDFAYQQLRRQRRLRMSPRELREEQRLSYGDPRWLAERRQRAQALRSQASLQELAAAQLVVHGPDALAVALRLPTGHSEPPVLWLKGRGELAVRMVQHAQSLGVPSAADPALCAALAQLELSEPVPPALYAQVARHMARP